MKIRFLTFAECKPVAKFFRVFVIAIVAIACLLQVNKVAVMATRPITPAPGGHLIENPEYREAVKSDPEYKLMQKAAKMATTPAQAELPPIEELLKVLEAEPANEIKPAEASTTSDEPTSSGAALSEATINCELPASITEEDFTALVKTLYGEANSVKSQAEKSMVVWVILNRLDAGGFGETITEICTKPMQFTGYNASHPVTEDNKALVLDVVSRWQSEKAGENNVGRTIPKEYLFFSADSNPAKGEWHNKFYRYSNVNSGEKIYFDRNNPLENPY